MDDNHLGHFLRTRRAGLQPEDVGMASYGARRVPGLRREEIAVLAGVNADYYTRLECSSFQAGSSLWPFSRRCGMTRPVPR
ncbi:hypothetical protein QFZ55_000026 [Streptomyces luteogriseus]|nr:hypothetical protein [Streptomyces luteogriseus]